MSLHNIAMYQHVFLHTFYLSYVSTLLVIGAVVR